MGYEETELYVSVGGVLAGIGGVIGFFAGWNNASGGLEKLMDAGCDGCQVGAMGGAFVGYLLVGAIYGMDEKRAYGHRKFMEGSGKRVRGERDRG